MIYKIADEIEFQRLNHSRTETGTIVSVEEMGTPPTDIYFVKLHDSATILHLVYSEIKCTIRAGLYTNVDQLVDL